MTDLLVRPARRRLHGSVPMVGDVRVAQLAMLLASVARGRCRLSAVPDLPGIQRVLQLVRAVGVDAESSQAGVITVEGRGLRGWRAPSHTLDCGEDSSLLFFSCGLLCAQPFASTLLGPRGNSRTLTALLTSLRARGAVVEGELLSEPIGAVAPPLRVGPMPNRQLAGLEYSLPTGAPDLKVAQLFAGLFASGPTLLSEPLSSSDHLERGLDALGVSVGRAGTWLTLNPPSEQAALPAFSTTLVGDVSAAAYVLAAGLIVPDSVVSCRRIGMNPTRSGFFEIVRMFGGNVAFEPHGEELGEPHGDVTAISSPLSASVVAGEQALRAAAELPAVLVLAATASGQTFVELAPGQQLTTLAPVLDVLAAFGVEFETTRTSLSIVGSAGCRLAAARVSSAGSAEAALCAILLALRGASECIVSDADCIAQRFPRFVGTLRALGAELEVRS